MAVLMEGGGRHKRGGRRRSLTVREYRRVGVLRAGPIAGMGFTNTIID